MLSKTKLLLALAFSLVLSLGFAQTNTAVTVSGTVKDEKGNPLQGITVTEKGTANITSTAANGSFNLKVRKNGKLVLTAVGYETEELATGSRTAFAIVLKETTSQLNDVVVVGYGSQAKTKVTGAVSTVKMEEVLGDRPVSTTATLLQGVVPGLQVVLPTGRPGESGTMNIRGATDFGSSLTSAINTGAPLILVDNIVFDAPLNQIDPNDIESVTVLKDAGAAAIYGARSAFGVILIQTKHGAKNQKVQFNYSNNFVLATPTNLPVKASPQRSLQALIDGGLTSYTVGQGQDLKKWVTYLDEYNSNPGKFPGGYVMDNGTFYNLKGNDAVGELLGNNATQFMNNLSISGGTEKTYYRISLGATNENGILVPSANADNFTRYNAKTFFSTDVADWMTTQIDAGYSYSNTTTPGYSDPYTYAVRIPSFLAGDTIPGYPGQIATGKNLVTNSYPTTNRTDQLRFTGRMILRPAKGLTVTGEATWDNFKRLISTYDKLITLRDPYGWAPMPYGKDQFIKNNSMTDYSTINLFAQYKKSFGVNNFTLMGGFNQEYKNFEQEIVSKTQIINSSIPSISTSAGAFDGQDNYSQFATRGFFGRLSYDYKDKYLVELNGRYDGSSRFPDGHRWGFFPSGSIGWRMMQENFMQFAKPYLNEFKLRASYGSVGNQNIAEYQYIASMNPSNPNWLNAGNRVVTVGAPGLISPDFTWEKVNTLDFGASFGMFKNRLTGEFDWYTRETKGILSTDNTPVPAVLGTAAPLINSASLKTNGFEIELTWRDKVGKVGYFISANLYDFTSVVTNVNNPNNLLSQLYVGQKLGEIWGYQTNRLLTTDDFVAGTLNTSLTNGTLKPGTAKYPGQSANPGDILYQDMNGDTLINAGKNTLAEHGDKKIIGNSSLRYQFGIRGGISYKNFDFSFVLAGVLQNDQFRSSYLYFPNNWQVYGALYQAQTDYWTPNNPNAFFGRIYTTTPNGTPQTYNEVAQSRFILNGAYLRVRNLTLRYNLAQNVLNKMHLKKFALSYSVENPFIFHHFPEGMYPDISNLGAGLGYPLMIKHSFGINMTF
jgi:TonB-linked SusC/RagA family outer membrane protein